jgi:hypothetical protein
MDRQHHSIPCGMHIKESKKSFSRAQINRGVRVRMLQMRQQTETLSTTTVPELEHLRLDDNTINGVILSALLWSGRRGLLRESIGAKLHASCRTAMISGPRYVSKVRTPACGGRNPISPTKTIHAASHVIPQTEEENVHRSEARPYEIPDKVFSQREYFLKRGVIQSGA